MACHPPTTAGQEHRHQHPGQEAGQENLGSRLEPLSVAVPRSRPAMPTWLLQEAGRAEATQRPLCPHGLAQCWAPDSAPPRGPFCRGGSLLKGLGGPGGQWGPWRPQRLGRRGKRHSELPATARVVVWGGHGTPAQAAALRPRPAHWPQARRGGLRSPSTRSALTPAGLPAVPSPDGLFKDARPARRMHQEHLCSGRIWGWAGGTRKAAISNHQGGRSCFESALAPSVARVSACREAHRKPSGSREWIRQHPGAKKGKGLRAASRSDRNLFSRQPRGQKFKQGVAGPASLRRLLPTPSRSPLPAPGIQPLDLGTPHLG